MQELVRELGADLRSDLSLRTATDIVWAFSNEEIYRKLVRERGWSRPGWLAPSSSSSLLTQIPDARTSIALRVHYQLPLHVGIVGATEEAVGAGMCLEADSLRAVGREMIKVRVNHFRKGGIVVQVGDRVLIESEKVGDPARSGVVTWVRRAPDRNSLGRRVRILVRAQRGLAPGAWARRGDGRFPQELIRGPRRQREADR